MKIRTVLAFMVVAIAGCGSDPQPIETTEAPQREHQRQIDKTQAADTVGYDGQMLKRTLERTVDQTAEHNRQSNDATRQAAGQ